MAAEIASWHGILRDAAGHVVGDAAIVLQAVSGDREYTVKSSASGQFAFVEIAGGSYTLHVMHDGKTWSAANPVVIADGVALVAADDPDGGGALGAAVVGHIQNGTYL